MSQTMPTSKWFNPRITQKWHLMFDNKALEEITVVNAGIVHEHSRLIGLCSFNQILLGIVTTKHQGAKQF